MNNITLDNIEYNFLKIANLNIDLSVFPILYNNMQQAKTDNDKKRNFGQVFTPVWLVDKMIIKSLRNRSTKSPNTFLDLCAGYGQFSIRWLRCLKKIYDKKNKPFNVEDILKNQIYFSELQPSSCYKLISIFGIENINLFIGDATKLDKLNEEESYRGIYVFSSKKNKWINIDKIIHKILKDEEYFVKSFEDKIIPKI